MSETLHESSVQLGDRIWAAQAAAEDVDRVVGGEHHDPHALLGAHPLPAGQPGEEAVVVAGAGLKGISMCKGERHV